MTRDELLTRYAAGERDFRGVDLGEVDLAFVILAGANLAGANLFWAEMTGANLAGANLTRANLAGANLTRANFTGANLYHTTLTGAQMYLTILPTPALPQGDSPQAIVTAGDLLPTSVWGQLRLPDALSGSRVVNGWLRTGYATGNGDGGER